MAGSFPVSVWYGVGNVTPRFSQDVWERDLRTLSELGFRFVRLWVNWRDVEPRPGYFDFSRLGELMSIAQKYGLKVIVQVYLEFAPDWLPRLYPDSLYISEAGQPLYPQGSPGVCLDHPQARRHAEEFLRQLASFLRQFSNFYGWDVWSEPQIIQWVYRLGQPRSLYCYCRHSIARFRDWLRIKYGTVDRLNETWHRGFSHIDDVEPPRFVVLHYATENIDWVEFNIEKLREDLEWRVKVIKSVDPDHVVTSHAPTTSLFLNPLYGNPDDWEMAKAVDIWGTSLYPKHASRTPDPVVDGFILDAVRSSASESGKDFWIGELQGGQGVGGLRINEPVSAEDIVVWIWQSIAHGAKGINIYHSYPMMWGYESSGYGLLNPDGSVTDRAKAAGEQARIISEYEDLLLRLRPIKADVAIMYNNYSYRLLWVLQEQSADAASRSMLGYYRILFRRNITVDFPSARGIERGGVRDYKLLIMPFSIALSSKLAESLKSYVNGGGFAIAEARFGWLKEDGWIDGEIPAYGLGEVFGASEHECMSVSNARLRIVNGSVVGVEGVLTLNGAFYLEAFRVKGHGATMVGLDELGRPAIVYNRYGGGSALWIGTFLGFSYEVSRDRSIEDFISAIVNKAGVKPPVAVKSTGNLTEARLLTTTGRYDGEGLLILINHDNVEVEAEAKIPSELGASRVKDLLTGSTHVLEDSMLRVRLKPRGVFVGYFIK